MIMLSYVYDQVKKERAEFHKHKGRVEGIAEGEKRGIEQGIEQGRAQRDEEVAALKARIAELERGRNGSEG